MYLENTLRLSSNDFDTSVLYILILIAITFALSELMTKFKAPPYSFFAVADQISKVAYQMLVQTLQKLQETTAEQLPHK